VLGAAWIIEYLAPEIGKWAFVAACLIGVAPVAQRAFAALRMGQPFTIESLMTIAAIGALFIDAAEEAALVVFLFAVGEVLEGVAAGKARDGIRALANLVPKTAQLVTGDTTREVPAASLTIGQTVLVRPGDRIPADGEIVMAPRAWTKARSPAKACPRRAGRGMRSLQARSTPRPRCGSKVTKGAEDNTIARIIRLVEEAEEARAPTERFIDRFSRWYMPAIVAVAALVMLVPPLAFGSPGTPGFIAALRCSADRLPLRAGHLGPRLHRLGHVHRGAAWAVDEGRRGDRGGGEGGCRDLRQDRDADAWPPAGDGCGAVRGTEAELLAVAAGVETGSSHPLAIAILNKAKDAGVSALPSQDAKALMGKGVVATVGGAPWPMGRLAPLRDGAWRARWPRPAAGHDL
jgi:Cd2+/Zn2+-exporting ATPase